MKRLAEWMVQNGFATGHGDTFEDLLSELKWQIEELRAPTTGIQAGTGTLRPGTLARTEAAR